MAATSGSLLGNYAPAMQEPYQIESVLAKEATGGSSALAATMLDQYWLERQMREGSYASRLADQMAFGKQQLQEQREEAALKALPELAKGNLLGATMPWLSSRFGYGLNLAGLQDAANLARASTYATNLGNAGKGAYGLTQAGVNFPGEQIGRMVGMDTSTGTPLALQVEGMREAGKNARGGAGGESYTVDIGDQGDVTGMHIKGKGGLPSKYLGGSSLAPAPGGGTPSNQPNSPGRVKINPVPNNQKRSDLTPDARTKMAAIINSTRNNNPTVHADIVAGAKDGLPHIQTDPQGNMYAMGGSGMPHPVGNVSALSMGGDDDESDVG